MNTREYLYLILVLMAAFSGVAALDQLLPEQFSIAISDEGIRTTSSGIDAGMFLAQAALCALCAMLAWLIAPKRTS